MDKRLTLFIPVACGIMFFLGFEVGGFQLVLLQTAQFFKLNNVMMGILVASQFSAITVGPLLFGWTADRFGKKIILQIFAPLFAVGCFGASISQSVAAFVSFVFVLGIGNSVCESTGSSAISDSFPGKESKYMNIIQCCYCLGAVLSPQIFSRLASGGLVTWRAVFLVAGSGYVLLYPLLCLSRCKEPTLADSGAERASGMNGRAVPRLACPFLFFLVAAMLTYVAVETGISFFANVIFVTEYSNTELGAYAISGFWLAMTVFRFVFALVKMKMRKMVLFGFSASCVLLILLLFFRNQWALMGLFILLGAVMAPVWPMIVAIGTSSFRERSATAASILTASGGLGGAVIPVLIGWVSEKGGFYGGFWLLVAASVIGFFAILKAGGIH